MPGLQFHIACGCRTQYCRRDNARRVASWVFTPFMKEGDTDESDIDTKLILTRVTLILKKVTQTRVTLILKKVTQTRVTLILKKVTQTRVTLVLM